MLLNQRFNMGCHIKRILQLQNAIQYQKIEVFNKSNDITVNCLYSWSIDGICWTNWTTIDIYNDICSKLETDFYLRVLLNSEFTHLYLDRNCTNCYNICIDSTSTFLTDFCNNTNLFQPYNNLDCALELQQQLSDSIICMFGIPIYYFKVDPNKETIDYTFKEYFLHHIDSVKQLKLMIPDGQMPSSNPKLTEFDFDWEIDWDTELSKTQFAKAFGDNAYPKAGDFIYIPMMKRMWEVSSAYDEKNEGLMWRSTTWKLALIKYTEATNVEPSIYDDIIDGWVQSYDETFGIKEKIEQERLVGSSSVQAPQYAATNLTNIFMEDSIRQQYTKQDITILSKNFNHGASIASRNIYKFKNENGCIVYQKPICGDQGVIEFIIETGGTLNGSLERNILSFGNINTSIIYNTQTQKFTIKFDKLKQELDPFKTYMVMLKWNRNTFNIEMNIYEYIHPSDVPVYKLRPEMYKFGFDNPVCELVGAYNNDFNMRDGMTCQLHAYPFNITNIKYYNKYLDKVESIKESIKYTTQHENCVINDLARPIDDGHGYAVK